MKKILLVITTLLTITNGAWAQFTWKNSSTKITTEAWKSADNWTMTSGTTFPTSGNGPMTPGSGAWALVNISNASGSVADLEGWCPQMHLNGATLTIENIRKLQGNGKDFTLKNGSTLTLTLGKRYSGNDGEDVPITFEGNNNTFNFKLARDKGGGITTVDFGVVTDDSNNKFYLSKDGSGTSTFNSLKIKATINGTIESDELALHSVVLGNISNITVTTFTSDITAEHFTQTTGVLTASDENVGKYSIVKSDDGNITLYWVTGPLLTVLTNAYAGARNINDGILTVNSNSSTISKKNNGDIVLYNESGFNTFKQDGNDSRPQTTISFRITLDTPTSFTKIFTYSTGNDWHVNTGGEVGIGLSSARELEGLWNGGEWSTLTTDALSAGEHIITVTIGESNNSYGTRVYVDGGSTFYSASGLKTSNTTYKYILINSDIANKINALYVYDYALSATEVNNVVSAIQKLPTPTTFPNNAKLYIIKDHNNNNLNVYYNGTNDYVRISNTSGNNDNYKWAIYTVNDKTYLYNLGANKFVCQIPGTGGHYSWPLKGNVANEMVITKNESNDNFNYYTFRSKYCTGDKDYLHYNSEYTYGSTNWGNGSDPSKWRITEVGVLTQEQQQAIEQAIVNNQRIPVAGKYYYIANDNDTKLQASDESGTLTFAATADRVKSKYVWKANVTAEGKFTFQNLASGKYLKHKGLQDSPYNFELENGFVPGQYSLYSEASSPYFVIKNDGKLDQASGTYNKTSTDYSTDYIFEEIAISTSETSTVKHPVLEGVIVSPEVVVSTINENTSILDLKNTTIIGTNIEEIKTTLVEYTNNQNVIIIAPEGTSVASTTTNVLLTTDTENTFKCTNLQLNDDVIAQFTTKTNFTADTKVTYTRAATESGWGTIYLPYKPEVEEGVSYYKLTSSSESSLTFTRVDNPSANTPYMYKKESEGGMSVTNEITEIGFSLVGDYNKYEGEPDDNGYQLVGILTNSSIVESEETEAKAGYNKIKDSKAYYFKNTDHKFYSLNQRFNMKAFRCYLTTTNNSARQNVLGFSYEENGEPTGVSFIENEDGNTVDVIFDLNGRRLQNAKKGINIINGKKVIK